MKQEESHFVPVSPFAHITLHVCENRAASSGNLYKCKKESVRVASLKGVQPHCSHDHYAKITTVESRSTNFEKLSQYKIVVAKCPKKETVIERKDFTPLFPLKIAPGDMWSLCSPGPTSLLIWILSTLYRHSYCKAKAHSGQRLWRNFDFCKAMIVFCRLFPCLVLSSLSIFFDFYMFLFFGLRIYVFLLEIFLWPSTDTFLTFSRIQ